MNDSYNVNALSPGTLIQEFKVVRILGAGSFGIVYLAENVYLPEIVAIKEFLPSQLAQRADGDTVVPNSSETQAAYQWALDKFVKEARILWDLGHPERHPNIASVSRFHEANGTAYMVMDFEEGEPLSEKLAKVGTLQETELKAITYPLLDGLDKVHAKSVWHRDIKPGNILIRTDGSPVLIDFGAARWEAGNQDRSIMDVFTPEYAAPEQIYSHGNLGPWTDIYCLAATLYRAIHGKPPTSPSQRALGADHVAAREAAAPGFDPQFLAGIDAALELKPEDRPQNVATWRRLLEGAAAARPRNTSDAKAARAPDAGSRSKPVSAARAPAVPGKARPGSNGRPKPAPKRRWTTSASVGAIVVGLLIVVVATYQGLFDESNSSESAKDEGQSLATGQQDDQSSPTGEELNVATLSDSEPEVATLPTGGASESVEPGLKDAVAVDPALLLAKATAIAWKLDCASLSVSLTDQRRIELSGFVDSRETLNQVRSQMAAIEGVKSVRGVVATHPRPFCSILELLTKQTNFDSKSSAPPRIQLDRATGQYFEGDRLMFTVTQTEEFDGYLYIGYLDSTGSLVHMLPTDGRAANKATAGEQISIGAKGRYEIAPPHGQAMIYVVATRQPLFRSMRPEVESADTYLPALAKRLESLSKDGEPGASVSNMVFFTTAPKG
jgi:serine/threonine protein kinase